MIKNPLNSQHIMCSILQLLPLSYSQSPWIVDVSSYSYFFYQHVSDYCPFHTSRTCERLCFYSSLFSVHVHMCVWRRLEEWRLPIKSTQRLCWEPSRLVMQDPCYWLKAGLRIRLFRGSWGIHVLTCTNLRGATPHILRMCLPCTQIRIWNSFIIPEASLNQLCSAPSTLFNPSCAFQTLF